jgi:hypothetical protein
LKLLQQIFIKFCRYYENFNLVSVGLMQVTSCGPKISFIDTDILSYTAANVKIVVFWDVTPCSLISKETDAFMFRVEKT